MGNSSNSCCDATVQAHTPFEELLSGRNKIFKLVNSLSCDLFEDFWGTFPKFYLV